MHELALTPARHQHPSQPWRSAILICDGAGWHQLGDALEASGNTVLLHLCFYRPELNPMENIWAYPRANKLCARVWNSYDDIVEACWQAWLFLINDSDRIRSIGTPTWATVDGQGDRIVNY